MLQDQHQQILKKNNNFAVLVKNTDLTDFDDILKNLKNFSKKVKNLKNYFK